MFKKSACMFIKVLPSVHPPHSNSVSLPPPLTPHSTHTTIQLILLLNSLERIYDFNVLFE